MNVLLPALGVTMRHGGERRGSALHRRNRKRWLLRVFGDGVEVGCYYCGRLLDFGTVTSDRLIPGAHGGLYVHDNVVPACFRCNSRRSLMAFGKRFTDYDAIFNSQFGGAL